MAKTISYLTDKFGSPISFKVLKYFLEHKLARDKKGYAVYELAFNIPPSLVLTKTTLSKIQAIADGTSVQMSEHGVELLIQKGILRVDKETKVLELAVPVERVTNLYLREVGNTFEEVGDISNASIVLLQTTIMESTTEKDSAKHPIVGVIDMAFKQGDGSFSIVENKFIG